MAMKKAGYYERLGEGETSSPSSEDEGEKGDETGDGREEGERASGTDEGTNRAAWTGEGGRMQRGKGEEGEAGTGDGLGTTRHLFTPQSPSPPPPHQPTG